jgi:hypothetical protein
MGLVGFGLNIVQGQMMNCLSKALRILKNFGLADKQLCTLGLSGSDKKQKASKGTLSLSGFAQPYY